MQKSTTAVAQVLGALHERARKLDLNDTEWSARAGVRKETLSRLRSRQTCDFATLHALANAVGAQLGMVGSQLPASTADGHFPAGLDRDYEARLVELCASRSLDVQAWSSLGPQFFMAGLAVMLASAPGHDRRGLLALAEQLHPGATEPAVFARWLKRSPVRPTRFLPFVAQESKHAA